MIDTFMTAGGIHVPAVTSEQMRAIDCMAAETTGPGLLQMMENAGRNLSDLVLATLGPDWMDAHVIVIAGKGGNGGGGICAARHLANRGASVSIVYADPDHLGSAAQWQRQTYRGTKGTESTLASLTASSADLIVDALIGCGLAGAPTGATLELILWSNAAGVPIVSLDIASGLDATTGKAPGEYVHCSKTLTLALPKTGLDPATGGELLLADVGIPTLAFDRLGIPYEAPFGHRYTVPLFVG